MNYSVPQIIASFLFFISQTAIAAPIERSGMISHHEIIRIISGLVLVLLLIVGLSWVTKRLRLVNLGANSGFQTIGTMIVGPKEKIIMLKISERYLLIGVGGGSINLLYDFGTLLPVGFNPANNKGFADILKSVVRKS